MSDLLFAAWLLGSSLILGAGIVGLAIVLAWAEAREAVARPAPARVSVPPGEIERRALPLSANERREMLEGIKEGLRGEYRVTGLSVSEHQLDQDAEAALEQMLNPELRP